MAIPAIATRLRGKDVIIFNLANTAIDPRLKLIKLRAWDRLIRLTLFKIDKQDFRPNLVDEWIGCKNKASVQFKLV